MRKSVFLGAAVLFCAPAAQAGTIEHSFGNTFVARTASGQETLWRYYPDGAYSMTAAGHTVRGRWAQNGEQLCTTPEGGEATCVALPAQELRVGDSITVTAPNGQELTLSLVAGQN
jgi:hypothetical protein